MQDYVSEIAKSSVSLSKYEFGNERQQKEDKKRSGRDQNIEAFGLLMHY
jgi:hypothetical protein